MQCIGVDVGKQDLVTYDGEKERVFPNRQGLPEFAGFEIDWKLIGVRSCNPTLSDVDSFVWPDR